MSETVHYKGKLIPVEYSGDLENDCQEILEEFGAAKCNYHDSFVNAVEDELYKKVVIIDKKLYKVQMKEIDLDDDIMIASKNDDGSIDFEVKYYNGGCNFTEAIEEAVGE